MLRIRGLQKWYPGRPRPAVYKLDLDVAAGEILGFVGLNGAGKTTVIRVCAGVIRPTVGRVRVGHYDIVHEKAEASRLVGWVPEFPTFEPSARALDQLGYYAGFYGESGDAAKKHGSALMRQVGLPGLEQARLRSFSQGMKKRFSLAAALLGDPQVMLFDEILNGLDPEGVLLVRNLMLDLRDQGKAILLSSHILAEVEQVADRVAVLHRARLRRTLSREEIQEAGRHVLRVTLDAVDAGTLEYLQSLGKVEQDGRSFRIFDPSPSPAAVNTELVRRNVGVSALAYERENLEDLFFRIIAPAEAPATPPARGTGQGTAKEAAA